MMMHPGTRQASPITPHYPVLDRRQLFLSSILRGRLAPEEWRPLLASSLIFYTKLKERYNLGFLFRMLPAVFLFLGFFALGFVFRPAVDPAVIVGFIIAVVGLASVGAYSGIRLGRKMFLEADNEAAEIVGRLPFLQTLEKLDSLRQLDEEGRKKWMEYGDHPTLRKRIRNQEK
jgi:hypothetical protein